MSWYEVEGTLQIKAIIPQRRRLLFGTPSKPWSRTKRQRDLTSTSRADFHAKEVDSRRWGWALQEASDHSATLEPETPIGTEPIQAALKNDRYRNARNSVFADLFRIDDLSFGPDLREISEWRRA